MEPAVVIALATFCFLCGIAATKILDFILTIDKKDERDEVVAKSKALADQVQTVLMSMKDKMRQVQGKYLECQEHLSDYQLRLDDALRENQQIRKSLNETDPSSG